jgi:hypothetical protein
VHRAFDIAAHPRMQSLSFGLMDFVSAHGGAIPSHGMGVQGQFTHPLVVRAKLEIASACHAHGKVPSHGVVTEFKDQAALRAAASRAANEFGYTRMWSIHPDQIRPILEVFAPECGRNRQGVTILTPPGRGVGADQFRRQTAGPGELPLLLAGAGKGAPDRDGAPHEAQAGSRLRVPSSPTETRHESTRSPHPDRRRCPPPPSPRPPAPAAKPPPSQGRRQAAPRSPRPLGPESVEERPRPRRRSRATS